jgi:hypothetical protein
MRLFLLRGFNFSLLQLVVYQVVALIFYRWFHKICNDNKIVIVYKYLYYSIFFDLILLLVDFTVL